MSEMLEKAIKYEFTQGQQIKAEDRPAFHITPYVGWMNDPNGFSCYKGEYHLFYQYNPYNTHWDSMHWGHVVSKDLLHWDYLPAALAPDQDYDKVGCFSGSAIELEDGRQLLMYTAVDREILEDGTARDVQTQAVAVGDGKDYVKYDKNPVLTFKNLTEGASRVDFRDPKIWKEKDGNFYCVIGSRPADGSGQILLYRSKNGFEWEFVSILAKNQNRYGKMWECPDFFELDGKYVLLTSPQDMLPEGLEFHNGNGTLCIIGELDPETHTLKEQFCQGVDYGIDYYAMQTLLAPDGRRIMIAWMQNWDTLAYHSTLCFRPDESVLKIDRKFSGSERALVHQSSCLVNGDSNELKLRVILDKFSVEVFINDGEQVMSAVILTKQEAKGISFFADGAVKLDIVKYDLL